MLSHRRLDLQHAVAFKPAVMTPYTFATIFLPAILGYYVMAVLVQLPRTRLYRTALLPVVFWITFRASMSLDFSWNKPGYAHLNQALSVSVKILPGLSRLKLQNPAGHVSHCNALHGVGICTAALYQIADFQVGKKYN